LDSLSRFNLIYFFHVLLFYVLCRNEGFFIHDLDIDRFARRYAGMLLGAGLLLIGCLDAVDAIFSDPEFPREWQFNMVRVVRCSPKGLGFDVVAVGNERVPQQYLIPNFIKYKFAHGQLVGTRTQPLGFACQLVVAASERQPLPSRPRFLSLCVDGPVC
jgi:hypothetical protein